MTSTKHQECYKTFIKTLEDKEFIKIDNPTNYQEDRDTVGRQCDSNVIETDGNFYYEPQFGKKDELVPVQNVSQIPINKLDAAVARSSNKQKNNASANSLSNSNFNVKKIKCEETDVKSADLTVSSENNNEDKVYEFDENEQDVVNSPDVDHPDYKTKGVIKKGKKPRDQEPVWFTCMVCTYRTGKKFLLSRHLKTHCDERPFQCGVCERQFKTKSALMNHRNIHLGYKPHACSSCDMTFTTSGELIRHERYRHTHIKPHKCTECDYSSVEMSKLRRHIRCHTGERPYQCPQCTYASPDTFKLKRHMRIHTGEKPYECDICHSRFTQSNSLKQHRLIHSVNDKPVFQCHLCPTTCGRKTDLRLHIKNLHSSDHPIPCKRCGKELPDRYSYKMHIKTHEGEKCYRCELCSYASISERHLESHMLIHMNSKPFVCDICGNSFRQKQLLKRHAKIYHSDKYEPPQPRKKDHKCPYCNKMFAFNGNLIRHMQIHDARSRLYEEKQQLKIGRMKRVQPDGTVVMETSSSGLSKSSENSQELCYKEIEEQQTDNEELLHAAYDETEELSEDNIQYVYDEYETEEYEELNEAEEYEQQQEENSVKTILIDIKPEVVYPIDISLASSKKSTVNLKPEHKNGSEIMVLEQNDDQGFMVIEVMPDDDDDDDEQQEEEQVHKLQSQEGTPAIDDKNDKKSDIKKSHKNSQSMISDYFGFEVNAEEEDNDDDEVTKGVIKMLEMIEEE